MRSGRTSGPWPSRWYGRTAAWRATRSLISYGVIVAAFFVAISVSRSAPTARLHDEAVGRALHDAKREVVGAHDERATLLAPRRGTARGAVVGSRRAVLRGAVGGKLQTLAGPSRQGDGRLLRSIHGPRGRVFLEHVDPRRIEERISRRASRRHGACSAPVTSDHCGPSPAPCACGRPAAW